jgi:hypothetical protein
VNVSGRVRTDVSNGVADDAVYGEPVSPCKFGKCREILTKCREAVSVTRLKTVRSQQLEKASPYSKSREGILP